MIKNESLYFYFLGFCCAIHSITQMILFKIQSLNRNRTTEESYEMYINGESKNVSGFPELLLGALPLECWGKIADGC